MRDSDAADFLSDEGIPKADEQLAENFGLTVKQVREFDPQTLDATRACRFLGLPLKRFDALAPQAEARSRWVQSVAEQKRDLIATFPGAGRELKEMLEAIRKFALRKCLKPDGPAQLIGGGTASYGARSRPRRGSKRAALIGGGVCAAILLAAGASALQMRSKSDPQAERAGSAKAPAVPAAKVPAEQPVVKGIAAAQPAKEAPDRVAAAYVHSVGGKVGVNGKPSEIAFDQLPKEPFQLTFAYMRNCGRVGDEGLKAFRGCRNLLHLDLVNTPATGAALANFKDCKELRVIDLVGSGADDDGLAHLADCTKLSFVWLGGTKVTDRGLMPFYSLRGLNTLDLTKTAVSDKGISGFAGSTSLRYLSLTKTAVGDAGLAALKDCPNLESLFLQDTKVTDGIIPTLVRFAKLKKLSFRGTKITAAGAKELAEMLPNCKVE